MAKAQHELCIRCHKVWADNNSAYCLTCLATHPDWAPSLGCADLGCDVPHSDVTLPETTEQTIDPLGRLFPELRRYREPSPGQAMTPETSNQTADPVGPPDEGASGVVVPEEFIIQRGPFAALMKDGYILNFDHCGVDRKRAEQWASQNPGAVAVHLTPVHELDALMARDARLSAIEAAWASRHDGRLLEAWTSLCEILEGES